MDDNKTAKQKRLRAGTACTGCRKKKLKCSGTPNCARCIHLKLECVVDETLFLKTNTPESYYGLTGIKPSVTPIADSSVFTSYIAPDHHLSCPSNSNIFYSTQRNHSLDNQEYVSASGKMAEKIIQPFTPKVPPLFGSNLTTTTQTFPHSHQITTLPPKPIMINNPNESFNVAGLSKKVGAVVPQNTPNRSVPLGGTIPIFSHLPSEAAVAKKRPTDYQQSSEAKRRFSLPALSLNSHVQAPRNSDAGGISHIILPTCTMSLDGHGLHFYVAGSGFSVFHQGSRSCCEVYIPPICHLNSSDLLSHSLKEASFRELPNKEIINHLLQLYFRFIYPFTPIFIRSSFISGYQTPHLDLHQILILNAIFCNASLFSENPTIHQDSAKYFHQAKAILDETYHVSKLSTIQALLLMSRYQYANGNYSGGWLYTGMAKQIAFDIGLHRKEVWSVDPEQEEIRKRVWWVLYISDRIGSSLLGRPISISDDSFNIERPLVERDTDTIDKEDGYLIYEPERLISCRLFWCSKLFTIMGKIQAVLYSIEAECDDDILFQLSTTQLPLLHNSLTSWVSFLPPELRYPPSHQTNGRLSSSTALMHMYYYSTMIMLHRPFISLSEHGRADIDILGTCHNISTLAASNICYISGTLASHGLIQETCYYGISCLNMASMIHIHDAISPRPCNRELAREGILKSLMTAHGIAKLFPIAETFIAILLDLFSDQRLAQNPEVSMLMREVATNIAPFANSISTQATASGTIFDATSRTGLSSGNSAGMSTIQFFHPFGRHTTVIPTTDIGSKPSESIGFCQRHIDTAIETASKLFESMAGHGQTPGINSVHDLPEALQYVRIEPTNSQFASATTTKAVFSQPPAPFFDMSNKSTINNNRS